MNEVAFQELLLDARTSESVSGLRKLVLASALRGDFDDQNERQRQLSEALNSIHALAASNKTNKVRLRKSASEIIPSEDLLSVGNEFVVELGAIATIEKGKTGIKDAVPGGYPLVVTAEGRLTADHFDFEGPAVIIPLVSSTGHGDASLKRIHYQDGKYAVGSILCTVQSRFPEVVHPRYLYEYLSTFKDELLVSRMSGTANVSLTVGKIAEVPVPLITYEAQEKLDRLMSLCDALEASGQLEAQQHAQLANTLLGTLTQSETPEALADNWQRIATHFDVLLDRPEAVDALEQTILQLAVRGLLVPQDPTDEPASVLLQKIRTEKDHLIAQGKIKRDKPLPHIIDEEKPFELQQGWSFARISELVEMLNGYAFKSEWFKPSGTRLLRNLNISHGYVDWSQPACIDVNAANEFSQFNLKVGDVVLSLDRPIISTGLKYAVIQEADLPCLLLQRVARLTPHPIAMSLDFLELWLQSDLFVGTIDPGRSNGVPHISTKQVGELFVGLPPMTEQSLIVTRVNELQRLCAELRDRILAGQAVQRNLADALVASD